MLPCPKSPMHIHSAVALAVFAAHASLAAQDDAPRFVDSSLAEVRAKAKTEGIALVVDFSHDASEPCRRLLQTTWRDAALWQWLDGKAFVVRVDPEKDEAAAKEFGLIAYPTIVVLGKNRKEVARVVGYLDAQTLRQRLEEALARLPTDWKEREAIAKALRREGDAAGALEHYLWVWDHGLEGDRSFGGTRVSSFLLTLTRFAKEYEPARRALEQRRDAAEVEILKGKIEFHVVFDMVHLNRALGTRERSVAVLDKVPVDAWGRDSIAHQVLVDDAAEVLIEAKRYSDAARHIGDPVAALDRRLEPMRTAQLPPGLLKEVTQLTVMAQSGPLEAFFALEDRETASRFADRLLEMEPGATTWLMILGAAKRAGNQMACHDYAVRALAALPEDDHGRVRGFLKRR